MKLLSTALSLASRVITSGASFVAPRMLHRRKFNIHDVITPKNRTSASDLVVVGPATLFTAAPEAKFVVIGTSRGEYTSNTPRAEFRHTKFGLPHYEVRVQVPRTVYDIFGRRSYRASPAEQYVTPGSTLHVDASLIDRTFQKQAAL